MLLPKIAFAWGPATHVDLALAILSSTALLPVAIASVITRFKDAFIYGAASPDIILGKKYIDYVDSGHCFDVAFRILDRAKTPRQKAAAYGYLVHLGADTVAHNYFIPFKIVKSYATKISAHPYWELRFDTGAREIAWKKLGQLKSEPEFDKLLDRELKRFLFSFRVNKAIFSTIVALHRTKGMRMGARLHAKRSRHQIHPESRKNYWDMSLAAALDVLKKQRKSYVIEADPMGLSRVAEARKLRHQLRMYRKKKLISHEDASELLNLIKRLMALAIFKPHLTLPGL